ncbi:HK97 family phage prohead protease [Vagococcus sp. BWB3-3]|uniref:HK97 family phage prohead protease n=1 Tax=Vagococcus allomyrinae TaxID=2794353 RepID=A0A940P2R2_9ENTE|nr:HK97 family phage prohead protease [Vagococcus allomyrinae]MBP1040372.1 HK97 family phage prohead protease [Vagococcus allomyrinae]
MKIKTGKKELRQVTTTISLVERRGEDGAMEEVIEGYALKFERWSEVLGGWFRERLARECLREADMTNVVALFNHDESQILGRSGINVELEVDGIGLKFVVKPTETSYSRDLMENIRQGIVNQCSFAFTVEREQGAEDWQENEEMKIYERTINKISRIFDVSVVTTPAYPDTEAVVGVRSKELVDDLENQKRSLNWEKEIELLSLEAESYA